MDRGRLEAFSDAVIAIIMTIMVLDLRPPEEVDWSALSPLVPVFLAYLLSFVYLGIYWNNHHHLLKAGTGVSAGIMWSNLALLFGLTLFPFATSWVGDSHLATAPTILYGLVLLYAALAYYVLQGRIVAQDGGPASEVGRALGRDWKGRLSPVLYLLAVALAFVDTRLSAALYVAVALMWLVPDRRLARTRAEQRA
jgi:uncharacterized membrane protein